MTNIALHDRHLLRLYVYTIPDISCTVTKTYRIGLSFTHKAPILDLIDFCAGMMLRCFGLERELTHIG